MSKICEQKALEAYPPEYEQEDFDETWDMNIQYREPYIQGYDQAMQDFMEKACKYLAPIIYTHPHLIDLDNFKNYMQNESEN